MARSDGQRPNVRFYGDFDDLYIPDPPCTFCAHARACRDQAMACYRFARYSGNAGSLQKYRKTPETPCREIYDAMFPGDGVIDWPLPNFLRRQAE